ncbi:MAG: Ig-like domain-containing protein, partial [Planctomycetota bacterium]|nr:Ig-like domain-containing protein [Planctomycetota bacterium]
VTLVDTNQDGKDDSITYTPNADFRGVDTFEYIVTDAANQTDRGTVNVVTAGPLPITDDFSDNLAQDFLYDDSQWQVAGERFTAITRVQNFAGVLIGEALPANVQFDATMNIQSVSGFNRNGYFIFNYQDDANYNYIGANQNSSRWEVVEVSNNTPLVLRTARATIQPGRDYELRLLLEGNTATLVVDGTTILTEVFDSPNNQGGLGLYTNKSKTHFDDVVVKEYVVLSEANDDRVSTKIDEAVTIAVLSNDYAPNGLLEITAVTNPQNGTVSLVDTNQDSKNDSVLFTPDQGFEGSTTFTYDILDPKGFTDSASVFVNVADTLSYTEDFDDGVADDFSAVGGTWEVVNQKYALNGQNADAIATLTLAEAIPDDFEMGVTMNVSSISGFAQNAFIVFDYISPQQFKFAGALVGGSRWTIGEYVNGSRRFLTRTSGQIAADTDIAISLLYQDNKATLKSGGESVLEWQFNDAGNDGKLGLFAINAQVNFDDFYAEAVDEALGD